VSDLKYSPDPIRQKELSDLGVEADVKTSFGGSRRAVVELSTEALDRLVGTVEGEDQHDDCVYIEDHERDVDEAKEIGRQEGYDEALADIEALAKGTT
jgi:hypothetical protein